MNGTDRFTSRQRATLLCCFLAYTAAYIGRLNLSPALHAIGLEFELLDTTLGALQTAFAIVYAAGQLAVGAFADRRNPAKLIAAGLLGSALANLGFALARSYAALVALWTLNGVAQCMLWTSIIRVIAVCFEGPRKERAAFAISLTVSAGHLLSWLLASFLVSHASWRWAFLAPALLLALVGLAWLPLTGRSDFRPAHRAQAGQRGGMPVGALLFATGLWAMLVCCVALGFVRDGILTWAPTMILRVAGASPLSAALLIPLLNLVGWAVSQLVFRRFRRVRVSIAFILLFTAAVTALLRLFGARGPLTLAALLGVGCAALCGMTPLVTAMLPLEYAGAGRAAMVAGLIDCFIYLGSALAGMGTGALSDAMDWTLTFSVWTALLLLGAGMALLSARRGSPKEADSP